MRGELMCPARMGHEEVESWKRMLGPYQASGQLQQRPSPAEGGILKRELLQKYYRAAALPKYFDDVCLSFDCAFKGLADSDYVAGLAMARLGADFYILPKRIFQRLDFAGTVNAVRTLAQEYPEARSKYIEDKANGPAVMQVLQHEIPGIEAVNPPGDGKVGRANAVSYLLKAGNVRLPHPDDVPWVNEFIENCARFPNGKYDDDVDAFTQGLLKMSKNMATQFFGEFRPHGPRYGESAEAQHVAESAELRPWWHRWISLNWENDCAVAHWYCQDADGRVVVYREFSQRGISAEMAGVKIAEQSRTELEQQKTLTIWVAPEHFDTHVGMKSIAQHFTNGIEKVLNEPVFMFAHTLDETTMGDEAQRMASLQARRAKSSARLMVQGAKTDQSPAVWEHAKALMRWWPLHLAEKIPYDRTTALRLRAEPDGERKYQAYMRMVAGEQAERLPNLLIDPMCRELIGGIAALVRDEKRQNVPFTPAGAAMSFFYGIVAHHGTQNREPFQEFLARHLDRVVAKRPDVDAQGLFMAEEKARADYQRSKPHVAYRFRHGSRRVSPAMAQR